MSALKTVLSCVVVILAAISGFSAAADTIAIIGTGNVANALGKKWSAAGHVIVLGSRTPTDARVQTLLKSLGPKATAIAPAAAATKADVVVLAVPGDAVIDVIKTLGPLAGKIILDPTNLYKVENGRVIEVAMPNSVAEQIQALAPGATVVKALNTLKMGIVSDPGAAGGPVTAPLAGDDDAAKARIARLIKDLGLEPFDVGKLYDARYLESMGRLYIDYLYAHKGQSFEFSLHPAAK